MTSGAANHRGTSFQDYRTPRGFLDAVVRRFGPLAFDLAASPENTVAPVYFHEADDSLAQDWSTLPGNLWLNPPYDRIEPWARRCAATERLFGLLLLLVPASVGSRWFAQHVHQHALVLALRPRLCFDGRHSFPKDLMLCCFGLPPGFDVWRWDGSTSERSDARTSERVVAGSARPSSRNASLPDATNPASQPAARVRRSPQSRAAESQSAGLDKPHAGIAGRSRIQPQRATLGGTSRARIATVAGSSGGVG